MSSQSTEDSFAEWYLETYLVAVYFIDGELQIPPRSGKSVPVIAHTAWAAWRASRKSVCIELPKPIETDLGSFDNYDYYMHDDVVGAIESQGYQVRVKGE